MACNPNVPCREYKEIIPIQYYAAAQTAVDGVSCSQACDCWINFVQDQICGGLCPKNQIINGVTVVTNANLNEVCNAYVNRDFYTVTVNAGPQGGTSTFGFGLGYDCETDKYQLVDNLINSYQNAESTTLQPKVYKFEPENCIKDQDQAIAECNNNPKIQLNCEAKWISRGYDGEEHVPCEAEAGGPCKLTVSDDEPGIYKVDWKIEKDPDWEPPNPLPAGCSPSPPPSPGSPESPDSPQPPAPTPGCVNGGYFPTPDAWDAVNNLFK